MNLLQLERPDFDRTRARLTNGDPFFDAFLNTARESDAVLGHTKQVIEAVHAAKRVLDAAESSLFLQEARLTRDLETCVDWIHERHHLLHTGSYVTLANLRRQTMTPIANPAPTAFTEHPSSTPPLPLPRTNHTTQTARRGRSRTGTGSSSSSGRQSRQQERNHRIAYPTRRSTPAPSPRRSGFRGTREAYLALQESRYGRDSDGEVREVDDYDGESSEDDEVQEISPEEAEA